VLPFLAAAAARLLFMTSASLIWQSRAERSPGAAGAQITRSGGSSWFGGSSDEPLQAPEASEATKEETRFSRADKMLEPRRKAFDSSTLITTARCCSRTGR
jgi:hypothetical protein